MRNSSNFSKSHPFLTHTNSRYEPKQSSCSPISSTTSSTATTTTLSNGNHNNSGDDSFSRDSSLTHSSELLLKQKCLHGADPSQFYHNFYDQINNCRCHNDIQIGGRNPNSSRNHRNFNGNNLQNVFSISKRNGFDAPHSETHIYHEISTQLNNRNELAAATLNPYDDYFTDNNNLFIYPVNGSRNDPEHITQVKENKSGLRLSSGLIV